MKTCPKCGREMDDELELCPDCAAADDLEVGEVPAVVPDNCEAKAPEETPLRDPEEDILVTESLLNPDDGFVPDYTESELPPKFDLKKIAVIAAGVLLVIGFITACVPLFSPDPKDVVEDAYDLTMDSLDDVFAKTDTLSAIGDIAEDIEDAEKLSMILNLKGDQLEISADGSETNFDISFSAVIDIENFLMAADLSAVFSSDSGDAYIPDANLNMNLATDGKSLMFKLPDASDVTYGVAIDEYIIDRFIDSYIYRNTSLCQMMPAMMLRMLSAELKSSGGNTVADAAEAPDELADAFNELKESFEYKGASRLIPMLEDLDVYRVKYDKDTMEKFGDLLLAYLSTSQSVSVDEYTLELLEEIVDAFVSGNGKIYVGVNGDGYLTALSLYDGEEFLSLVLQGKENVWESFGLYIDSELILKGGMKQTKGGFELSFVDTDDVGFVVGYNDKAGKLTVTIITGDFGEIDIPVYYDVVNNGKGMSFELDLVDTFGFGMSFEISAADDEIKMLDTSFVDVLGFTEAEFEQFMLDFTDGIFGGMLSEQLGSAFTYDLIFNDSDVSYYD